METTCTWSAIEELACAGTWEKTAAEKAEGQCWKYLLVYVQGYNCKKSVT